MKDIIGIIAVIITFIGYIPYIRDTIKGKTKPHIYSWFIWAFITLIIFALQIFGHGGAGAFTTLATAVLCLTIFILGAVRNFLGIIALANYSLLTWLYPVTNLLINILVSSLLIIRRKHVAKL